MERREVSKLKEPRLLVYKLAAVLHDPAWKPWVVSASFGRLGRVFAGKPGGGEPAGSRICKHLVREISVDADAHALDAAAAAQSILEPLGGELASKVADLILGREAVVSEADRLAAALDRWVLTYREKELRKVKVDAGKARYVNPLDPRFSYEPKAPHGVEPVCRFVEELRGLAGALREAPLPLVYNVLLFALEPLWYKQCRGCVPLADTRTPTHTVFDHVYATASMINWLHLAGKPEGFMVKLDVAGIQEFISSARKTRDLWAGSWLVSVLAWYTVAEAVMLLGADTVLSPYPLANHFFIATLLKELGDEAIRRGEEAGKDLAEALLKLEDLAHHAFLWSGAANQPIVPGTFFLALPCIDEEEKQRLLSYAERMSTVDEESAGKLLDALASCDAEKLRDYFVERFRRAWQEVATAVIETYKAKATAHGEPVEGLGGLLGKAGALDGWAPKEAEKYINYAVSEPPLRLRVTVVDVAEEYGKLLSETAKALTKPNPALAGPIREAGVRGAEAEEFARKLLFHHMFSRALPDAEEQALEGSLTIEPGYRIADILEELTSRAFSDEDKKSPGFHECSVCGRLPSVAYVWEEILESGERVGARWELQRIAGIPPSMFTVGERLCPYCLIRRLMTLDEALERVMEALNLYKAPGTKVYPRVPSTSELAALSQYLKLIDSLAGEPRYLQAIHESIRRSKEVGEERLQRAPAYVTMSLRAYIESRGGEQKAALLEVLGALEAYYDLSHLMVSGGVKDVNTCENAGLPHDVCQALAEAAEQAGIGARRYYVVVRGDGDLFGSCIVRGILGYDGPEEYVEKLLEKGVEDEAAKEVLGEYYGRYARLLSLLAKHVDRLDEDPTVVLTPSYYAALSRGQMITALYDAAIVTALGGFPVYAGGDDVAALVPGNMAPEQLQKLASIAAGGRADPVLSRLPSHLVGLGTGSAAAAAVVLTRRNYWGLLGIKPGFHVTPVGAVYAAPVAYGRSYGVYVAHYRDPFQAVWRAAGDLEEMKDTVRACAAPGSSPGGCSEKCSRKDMVFLSYGRVSGIAAAGAAEPAALPNLAPCATKDDVASHEQGTELVAKPLENAVRLLEYTRSRIVSRSIVYDFEREARLAEKLAKRMKSCDDWSSRAAERLAAMLAERNAAQGKEREAAGLIVYCSHAYVEAGAEPRPPLPWQVARAAKVLSVAGR